jgi:uncharacterized cupin superfamily protein
MSVKSFERPDETRTPEKAKIEVLDLGAVKAARLTAQPGWRWTTSIKPVVGTESCQARHVGTAVAGRLHLVHEDGTELELSAGDAYVIEPGHDAWVVGNEPFVAYEFDSSTAETYAKKS